MMNKEDLLKELDYHGAKCLKKDIEDLYTIIDTLTDLLPNWAKVQLEDIIKYKSTKEYKE